MENTDKKQFSITNIVCKINILKMFQIIKLLKKTQSFYRYGFFQ